MTNQSNLTQQVAIVTGAGRGIGRAICISLCRAGAYVIATDILKNELVQTVNECGENATAISLDVTDEGQWQDVISSTLNKHGRIDILVNNAGVLQFATLEDTTTEQFRNLFDINVTGTFLGMNSAIPAMKKARAGVIINMSSSSAILPNNGTGAYNASKFAVLGLTKTAALELGPYGIRVNSVHPGGVNTPMTNPQELSSDKLNARFKFVPQQRGCEPEEIANAVLFLASEQGSYCNGTELVVDGGLTAGQYFYGVPGAPGTK